MNTLSKKKSRIKDKRSTDPIDRLIFEKGLRIKHLLVDKDIDLLAIVLSNSTIIKSRLSDFPKLRRANEKQLNNWELIGGGIGIEWGVLDEDLSLKGFIKNAYMNRALRTLEYAQEDFSL